jgi:hypothetical protein
MEVQSGAEIKNTLSFTYTLHVYFNGMVFMHRDMFTFLICLNVLVRIKSTIICTVWHNGLQKSTAVLPVSEYEQVGN